MSQAITPPVRRVRAGRGHRYLDANRVPVPGVTTILGDGLPKKALVGWGIRTVAEYAVDHWQDLAALTASRRLQTLKDSPYADRDAAANRGTEVHRLAQHLVHDEQVEVPDELAGHVEAYVRFLDQWAPEPVLAEATVVHYKVGYAGTLDLVADMAGRRWLLDIKTSRSGVFPDVALQLAAYRYAEAVLDENLAELPVPQVDDCAVVWVRGDGYQVVPVVADETAFLHFRYVRQVARWQNELADQVVLDALPAPVLTEAAS